uniref:Uncharacterized protein n=1 Tax=Fagus sylvatica TaxID=28930 RepID=A0A2N9IRM6_FAGSY
MAMFSRSILHSVHSDFATIGIGIWLETIGQRNGFNALPRYGLTMVMELKSFRDAVDFARDLGLFSVVFEMNSPGCIENS